MKIVVTSSDMVLDAPASPVFGRCPAYVFVDTDSMAFEAVENSALGAASGAGIQAAQFVVEQGAQAVITGNVGPNAFNVLWSAGVPIYLFGGGTVRQAVEAFKAGELQSIAEASARGGMGMRRGMGQRAWGSAPSPPPSPMPAAGPLPSHDEEIAVLKEMAADLRGQLAEVLERLDRLEGEGGAP